MILALRDTPEGCFLPVRIHTGAPRDGVHGAQAGALKVSLTSPPEDGQVNATLLRLLADRLGIPLSHVHLLTGAPGRAKVIRILGLTGPEVEERLLQDLA